MTTTKEQQESEIQIWPVKGKFVNVTGYRVIITTRTSEFVIYVGDNDFLEVSSVSSGDAVHANWIESGTMQVRLKEKIRG